MSKVKRADFESFVEQSESEAGGSSACDAEQQVKKRQRASAPLNFSIESIMKLAPSPAQQQAISPASSDYDHQQNDQRSYLKSGNSPTYPSSASASGGESSAASSRASTPISPGVNAIHDEDQDEDDVAPASPAPYSNASTNASANHDLQQQRHAAPRHKHHQQRSSKKGLQATSSGGAGSATANANCDARLAPFECQLDNKDMWDRFHPLDTEMIITKQGRRMFPPVRVTFSLGATATINGAHNIATPTMDPAGCGGGHLSGLNPREKYQVLMDILPYDNKRYRYAYHKSSWQQAGKADPYSPTKLFLHPDGPFTLDQLKRQVISFEKIKLTNNDANKHGFIVLNSMHKYQPRIHLALWRGKDSQNLANAPISHLEQEICKTFIFKETIFTAVTAYQNHSITKLKIDSNPFAKGFRDSSRLTDLELESMQDLISDGQCPFSPPRAPPHGFPHFLFAAAAASGQPPNPNQMEDPASALLRERTIMALDSFLQQQQQQQHHNQPPSASPHHQTSQTPTSHSSPLPQYANNYLRNPASGAPPYPQPQVPQGPLVPPPQLPPTAGAGLPQQPASGGPSGPLGQQQQQLDMQLEQLIMQQQQQQFAAAMAAAAAQHHRYSSGADSAPGNHLFNPPPPPYSQAIANGTMPGHQHRSPSGGAPPGNSPKPAGSPMHSSATSAPSQTSTTNSTSRQPPLSPISVSKSQSSAAHHEIMQSFHSQTQGGATGGNQYAAAAAAAAVAAGFHPQHLQAMMMAHHQHQMAAALSLQLDQKAGRQPPVSAGGVGVPPHLTGGMHLQPPGQQARPVDHQQQAVAAQNKRNL